MKRSCYGHSKLKTLATKLKLPEYAAVGVLESLWHLTAREAPRGDIGRLTDEQIGVGIGWDRDHGDLVRALVTCRWIDECTTNRLVIHDWQEHADDAAKKSVARKGLEFATVTDKSRHVGKRHDKRRLPKPKPLGEDKSSPAAESQPDPPKPKHRNEPLDALVAVDGTDPLKATSPAFSAAGKALATIREVSPDVTAAEIRRRAENYRLHMRDATISAFAVAKHWAKCEAPPRAGPSPAQPQANDDYLAKVRAGK